MFFFFLLGRRVCFEIVTAFIEDYGALVLVKTELVVDRSYVGRRDIVPCNNVLRMAHLMLGRASHAGKVLLHQLVYGNHRGLGCVSESEVVLRLSRRLLDYCPVNHLDQPVLQVRILFLTLLSFSCIVLPTQAIFQGLHRSLLLDLSNGLGDLDLGKQLLFVFHG